MSTPVPVTSTADHKAVGGTAVAFDTAMVADQYWVFTSSTGCYIRQGTAKLLTVVALASLVDGETFSITHRGATVVYELDVAGDGVVTGNTQVDVSGATTAADVAAIVATAIEAEQDLEVTDHADGTLTIEDTSPEQDLAITEAVANAGFTVAAGVMQAAAADGSTYVAAGESVLIYGTLGPTLGVLQESTAGVATLTRASFPR